MAIKPIYFQKISQPIQSEALISEPVVTDLEELEWKKKVGNEVIAFERQGGDSFKVFVRYKGFYCFNLSYNKVRTGFLSNAIPADYLTSDGEELSERGKAEILKSAQATIDEMTRDDTQKPGKTFLVRTVTYHKPNPRIKLDLVLSQTQLKDYFCKRKFHFIGSYFENTENPCKEKRFKEALAQLQTEGKQALIDDLFIDYDWSGKPSSELNGHETHPRLRSLLLDYITLENERVCEKALSHAVRMNLPEAAKKCLDLFPSLIQDDWNLKAALQSLNLDVARVLIEEGISVNPEQKSPFGIFIKEIKQLQHPLESEQEKIVLEFVQLLLDKGALVDFHMEVSVRGELSLTVAEDSYFYRGNQASMVFKIGKRLIEHGAKITSRMAFDMKFQMREMHSRDFITVLKKQGLMTEEEEKILFAEARPSRESSALIQEALQANQFLEEKLVLCHMNPDSIPIEKIKQIRLLKKEIKKFLKKEQDPILTLAYEKLKQNYALLSSNHFLLHLLRTIRLEDIATKTASVRLLKFFSLFSPEKTFDLALCKERIGILFLSEGKSYWNHLIEKVFTLAQAHQHDKFLRENNLLWFHGTRHTTCLKAKELEPMGMLLKKGIAPLCGEISGSDTNLNSEKLSGIMLSFEWDDEIGYHFKTCTRGQTPILYASKDQAHLSNKKLFDADEAWNYASLAYLDKLGLGDTEKNGYSVMRVSILRLRMTDKEADQKLKPLKARVEFLLEMNFENSKLDAVHDALICPLAYEFSQKDLEHLKNPYPVIFASANAYNLSRFYLNNNCLLEFNFLGKAEFGKDLQAAFTLPEKIEELKTVLNSSNLHIYPMDMIFYLEMQQMQRGSLHKKWKEEGIQNHIAHTLQHDILPLYATPFPENPTYENEDGQTVPVEKPFYGSGIPNYAAYKKLVEEGKILPRGIHGTMHATRTSIWTQLFAPGNYLAAITGNAHDWRREDEGIDRWDQRSANSLRSYLLTLGYEPSQAAHYAHAIAEKDPLDFMFTSDIQKAVHNADVLEIMRVLKNDEDFRPSELCLSHLPEIETIKFSLIDEVREFIKITENYELKLYLERHSKNYYGDVLRILKALHDRNGHFPHLVKLLKNTIEPFVKEPLDPNVLQMLPISNREHNQQKNQEKLF